MSKGPIILLGAAAVVGVAIAATRKSEAASSTPAAAAPSKGTTAKDLTTAQKAKLDKWAKEKGVPLDKAYDLAKSVYGGLKF